MNRGYKVDVVKKAIIITKSFAKAAGDFTTKEYKIMMELRNAYPGYAFKDKTITTKADKVTYNGLTINKMRAIVKYVAGDAAFNGFDDVIAVYRGQSGKYATIKKVFLARYGESYTELLEDVDKMVEVDRIAKELEAESNGTKVA